MDEKQTDLQKLAVRIRRGIPRRQPSCVGPSNPLVRMIRRFLRTGAAPSGLARRALAELDQLSGNPETTSPRIARS